MNNTLIPKTLLVIRNDRLGDFLLAWPAFALLRSALPETTIEALVPNYTAPLAAICPSIDQVLLEPAGDSGIRKYHALRRVVRDSGAQWALVFATRLPLALALWGAGIPRRLAPATKVDQLFYTDRLLQRRSRSIKPEWAYNVDLARHALTLWRCPVPDLSGPPYLRFDPGLVQTRRDAFLLGQRITGHPKLVFLHPGDGGSAENWPPEAYAYFANRLLEDPRVLLVVTSGPGEERVAEQVLKGLGDRARARLYPSTEGIVRFAEHVAFADLWISGSTGPLHLAGALNRPTVAFYPRRHSGRALRWETINEEKNRLAFEVAPGESGRTGLDRAARLIRERFLPSSGP